jgi:hypothetical protein
MCILTTINNEQLEVGDVILNDVNCFSFFLFTDVAFKSGGRIYQRQVSLLLSTMKLDLLCYAQLLGESS